MERVKQKFVESARARRHKIELTVERLAAQSGIPAPKFADRWDIIARAANVEDGSTTWISLVSELKDIYSLG